MCGIAGFVDPSGTEARLVAMCQTLVHRGPDDAGARLWPDHGVGLGHRRLSIIDLSSAGRNPIGNEDGTVWVVHNGEIYNYRELRRELERAGHRFASQSDTEVIVHAYEEWGDGHVERLRGMFAYGVYDRRGPLPRVLLVRDRVGIKPLHYSWDGGRLAFASEAKGLLRVPWVNRSPDRAALADYLVYGYIPAPETAYLGIRKIGPAERLLLQGGRLSTDPYWDLPSGSTPNGDAREAQEFVEKLLADAVESHMVSDVPVGLFLSGGVDSSSIAALMPRKGSRPRAYSIGFDVAEHTETAHAQTVADHLDLDLRTRTVAVGDALAALDHIVEIHDEPFSDASSLPMSRVARLASEDVKVALSGDGGDEVFGGYWWYGAWRKSARSESLPALVRRVISGIATLPRLREVTWLRGLHADSLERYAGLVELFPPALARDVLSRPSAAELDGRDARWHLREYWREELDPRTRAQYVDFHTYLPGDILTKVDRASMSVSLEVRPPLLDHELVEAVMGLPSPIRGEDKALLRRAMARRLPVSILARPKKGFSVPWFRWQGQLQDWATDTLRDGAAVQAGLLAPDPASRIGTQRGGARLWSLLVLERWCQHRL
jgi:asparagine synthase (glutamine-hydrolysing)